MQKQTLVDSLSHFFSNTLKLLRMDNSLKASAMRGAAWTIASYGISQVLRLGGNLALSALLSPKLFGLMMVVNIFIVGLQLFTDIGLGPSLIQNKRSHDPNFYNTAWTLQIVRSIGIWLCCLGITVPAAQLYQEPQLLWLIPVVGFSSVISGFNSTSLFALNRELKLRKLTLFNLGLQVFQLVCTLIWARLNPTIWALVGGMLVHSLSQMLVSHRLIANMPHRFTWDKAAAREIFSFGKWIFLSTVLTFCAEQADRMILGKLISFEMLGVYGVAFTFADVPRQVTLAVSSKVLFPTFTKMADLPRATFREKVLKYRKSLLLAIAAGLTLLVGFGDGLVLSLYDDRYEQAAWMLPILALGIWPRVLTQSVDQVLFALGRVYYPTLGCLLKFLFVVTMLPLGYQLFGLPGAIAVVALNDLPFYLAIAFGLWREKMNVLLQDLQTTAVFVLMLGSVLSIRWLLGLGLPIDLLFSQGLIP